MKKLIAATGMFLSVTALAILQVVPRLALFTLNLIGQNSPNTQILSQAFVLGGLLYFLVFGADLGLLIIIL